MIYTPNPKELNYQELYFISTSVPRKPSVVSVYAAMDEIMDTVSGEVYELFVGVPMEAEQPKAGCEVLGGIELFLGTEIAN